MKADLQKTCGAFEIEGQYGGYPHWHTISYAGTEFRGLQIDDLKDLEYLIRRAIEHHEKYGYKPS